MNQLLAPALLSIAVLSGCGGRAPDPVDEIQSGDGALSCSQLRTEITANTHAIQGLVKEQQAKTTQNIVAGTAGAFLVVPWFFMDLKGAAGDEARAYQRRNESLVGRYNGMACKPEMKLEKPTAKTG
ncbi:hypothetical protein ACSSVY_000419 [Roseovarius sp. MBR-51]